MAEPAAAGVGSAATSALRSSQSCSSSSEEEDSGDHAVLGYAPLLCGSDSDDDDDGGGDAGDAGDAEMDAAAILLRALEADYRACLSAGSARSPAAIAAPAEDLQPAVRAQPGEQPAAAQAIKAGVSPTAAAEATPSDVTAFAGLDEAHARGSDGDDDLPSAASVAVPQLSMDHAGEGPGVSWTEAAAPAAQVQQAMAGITIPASAWPAWAHGLTDAELMARVTGPPKGV